MSATVTACVRSQAGGLRVPLDALYAATSALVFSHALRITRSREAAADIVQDVFMHVWLNTETYDDSKAGLKTWLLMLCRSRAIDYLRRHKTCELDHAGAIEAADGQHPDPSLGCDAMLRRRMLELALRSLAPLARQMLVLSYYSELSHAEIAARMDMPLGTVKTTLRRAKMALASQPVLAGLSSTIA